MENKYYLISILVFILSVSTIVFFSGYDSVLLGFSGERFTSGEVWRLASFSFSHINSGHLIENMLSLIFVVLLSYEFGLSWKQFLLSFFVSGLIIAMLNAVVSPALIMAGASLGTYAVLGTLAMKGHAFISRYILIALFSLSITVVILTNIICPGSLSIISLESSVYHFAGFISGIGLFYLFSKRKTKFFDLE